MIDPEEKSELNDAELEKPIALPFAPAWKRVLSYIIDSVLIGILINFMFIFAFGKEIALINESKEMTTIINQINSNTMPSNMTKEMNDLIKLGNDFRERHLFQMMIVNFVVQLSYFVLGWIARAQTLGGKIMGIAVLSLNHQRVTFFQGMVRFSLIFFSYWAFYLPMIFIINPAYQQRIHDVLTGTVVIELPQDNKKRKQDHE